MSNGPIARERAGTRAPAAELVSLHVGDLVTPTLHPAGFPVWRVIEIPPAAAPSDVVTLAAVDHRCIPGKIRRYARDLTPTETGASR